MQKAVEEITMSLKRKGDVRMLSNTDRQRLERLAHQQVEIAHSEKTQKLLKDWERHGRFDPDSRPMVTIELGTFRQDIVPPLMECAGEEARKWEERFLENIVNHTLFDDDTIVLDYMPFSYGSRMIPFCLPIQVEHAGSGDSLGHHFVEQLTDLEQDFHKLRPSEIVLPPKEETDREMAEYNELFGHILPARLTGHALYACPVQDIIHLMSMENMFFAMVDYPELFHKMMEQLTDDYITRFRAEEQDGRLLSTTGCERVAQGSYCFTDKLPDGQGFTRTVDIWGYMDCQESAGLSPAMYGEMIFPYYKKVMDCYGLVSYGCCEAVHAIWDDYLSTVENLGKVSISPWCNEEFMGQRLQGKEITYLRKPDPTLIGVTGTLDEDSVRKHFRKTVQAAKDCTLEIVQRDVYQIHNSFEKVKRYVELIREECSHHQK